MKTRTLKWIAALAPLALLLAGCAKEIIDPQENAFSGRGPVFSASYDPEDPATKTQMDGEEKHILWSAGDKISIFDSDEIGYEFTTNNAGSSASFTLTDDDSPSDTDLWYALYPYDEDADLTSGVITTTLKDEYTVDRSGSFNDNMNISVAKSSSMSLSFKNVLSWLRVASAGLGDDVVKIEMRGNNGENLAGQIEIDYNGEVPDATLVEGTGSKVMTINVENYVTSVNQPKEERVFFYIPVLPQTFENGFNLTFISDSGVSGNFYYSEPVTFVRNKRSGMFAGITPSGDEWIDFADEDFEEYCVANFDFDQDGGVSKGEAAAVTDIDVCTDEITDLGGIEYFVNLKTLHCTGSVIQTRGDVAYAGVLETLDVTSCVVLEDLDCHGNKLQTLDLSCNPELTDLDCSYNLMTELDVSANTELAVLDCSSNQLNSLDVSNNMALESLACTNSDEVMPTLYVSAEQEIDEIVKDGETEIVPLVPVEDPGFLQQLLLWYDSDEDGKFSVADAEAIVELWVYTFPHQTNGSLGVESIRGIEYMTNLEILWACGNNLYIYEDHIEVNGKLRELDLSKNTKLRRLECRTNLLTSLDLSNNPALEYVDCHANRIPELNLSNNPDLKALECSVNCLTDLDLSNNPQLDSLLCERNLLGSLDLSNNPALRTLICQMNNITELYVTGLSDLKVLNCSSNQIQSLDVSQSPLLSTLSCSSNQLTSLDVSENLSLNRLYCKSNPDLATIYLSRGQEIQQISKDDFTEIVYKSRNVLPSDFPDDNFRTYVFSNFDTNGDGVLSESECDVVRTINVNTDNIISLDGIEFFPDLSVLRCGGSYNQSSGTGAGQLASLNLSQNKYLDYLICSYNELTELDLSANTRLWYINCSGNHLTSIDVTGLSLLKTLTIDDNPISELDVANNSLLKSLSCSSTQVSSIDVSGNPNLEGLTANDLGLTSIDVISNPALSYLSLNNNNLTELDLSSNSSLTSLYCNDNQLSSLSLSNLTLLEYFQCGNNQLKALDLSSNGALKTLGVSGNLLTSLDLSGHSALTSIGCSNNNLSYLNVSGATALTNLTCRYNELETLDLTSNTALGWLECRDNPMETLYLLESHCSFPMNCPPDVEVIYQ